MEGMLQKYPGQIDAFYPTEPEIIDRSNVDDFLVQLAEWTK